MSLRKMCQPILTTSVRLGTIRERGAFSLQRTSHPCEKFRLTGRLLFSSLNWWNTFLKINPFLSIQLFTIRQWTTFSVGIAKPVTFRLSLSMDYATHTLLCCCLRAFPLRVLPADLDIRVWQLHRKPICTSFRNLKIKTSTWWCVLFRVWTKKIWLGLRWLKVIRRCHPKGWHPDRIRVVTLYERMEQGILKKWN